MHHDVGRLSLGGDDEVIGSKKCFVYVPWIKNQMLPFEEAIFLSLEAILQFSHCKYEVFERFNAADMSINGEAPLIRWADKAATDLENAVHTIQSIGTDPTKNLNLVQMSDLRAFMWLPKYSLRNVLLYHSWVDEDEYKAVTYHKVGAPYAFPLNKVLPWNLRRRALEKLRVLGWADKSREDVIKDLDECLQNLNERLGHKDYFFEEPTQLDALVFGYVQVLRRLEAFSSYVKKYDKLVALCDRIFKNFGPFHLSTELISTPQSYSDTRRNS